MRGPHNILRLIRTGATMERTGALKVLLDATKAPRPLRMLARGLAWPIQWIGIKGDETLPPITRAITALGPAYIKFGQILSTRADVVGPDLAMQLRVLQDQLPPFGRQAAIDVIEEEFETSLSELFSEFSEPIAAASIAQVHKARKVGTNEEVAVKVVRPNIERAFRKDIDAFYFIAWVVERFLPSSRRLRPQTVIAHFESVVLGELDLRLESSSAAEFYANTLNDEGFSVPKVDWSLSSRSVMTLDWVEGIAASDLDQIDALGYDRAAIGKTILQMFLSHALRDGFFHADMHQGNLKIVGNGNVVAIDFGIMGSLDAYTRRVYAEIILGFIRQDYRRIAEVHFEAGYVPADQDIDAFTRALRAVGDPISGMDATQISMGRVMAYLLEVTDRFGMATRTELILLQRTMVVVEGVARTIDPNINIWEVSQPIVENYIKENIGPKALVRDLGRTAVVLSRFGPRLPELTEALLSSQLKDNEESRENAPWKQAFWLTLGGGAAAGIGAVIAICLT